ncbi:MAG: hypothetical protein NVV57_09725 [Demequina sp.]|nr:hypothetical protein [Demequina sp.]
MADLDHCQGPTIEVHSGDTPTVRLEVRDDHAGRAVTSREIAPKDLVVVSLGDSVASGEGSPLRDQSGTAEVAWTDRSCHSSPYAGPALAAKQLEDADPHTAVTFVQLACSGAAIVDTFDDPSHRKGPGDADDPSTGGVKDAYAGVEHAKTCDSPGTPCPSQRPSQLTQMQQLLGPRDADAVLVSVGANDVRFSGTLKSCLLPPIALPGLINGCNDGAAAGEHDSRMDELPARYQQLANGFDAASVDPATVHITEYFDPTGDKYGVSNLRCVGKPEGLPALDVPTAGLWALASNVDLITDSEAIWARSHVVAGLNGAVRDAASGHGWDYVGGITSRFATHGYCSDEPWIVRLGESVTKQHDEFGAFHPNKAGQEVYGDALYTHLAPLVQVPPTKVTDAAPGGSASVGDVVVLASDVWAAHPELRSVTLTTTGGQPLVGAVRRLQSGSGWGEVATDGKSAVGVWAGEHGGFAAQIASRPNATVNAVSVVQASDDASRLVTNRKTAVHATLSLAGAGARATAVTTTVTAHGDLGDTQVFGPTTEQVLLQPGVNDVLLPVDEVLEAPPGATLVATVKVDDPPGAAEGDDVDNELSTSTGAFAPTIDTRPLKVVFIPLDFGSATVTCGDIATQANIWVAWAQQLLPVPDSGVQANLSCTPELLATSASADGVAQALGELDLLARESGVDSVVGIAPHGWLGNALGDSSVARASVTGRSIIIDSGAPQATLAHELGHNLGLEHSELPPATGAWVSRNRIMHGPDFMSAVTDGTTQEWVSGETWDLLTGAIAEGSAPQQPEPGGSAFWVRGVMPLSGDSLSLDPFIDDGNIPSPPPDGSDVSRLVVVPLAGDGTPSGAAVQVGLTRDESLGGDEGATLRFAQKVVAPAGTVKFRFIVDGTTVAERTLGSAPTISLTSPTAGTSLSRADTIHVAWTVSDPDTSDDVPAPIVNLLVSDDGGATWRPLASGFTGSSADVAVPRDLGGDAIVVRAVASDGVHLRWADSGTFSIDPAPKLTSDRIAFVSGDPDVGRQGTGGWAGIRPTWDRIGTMKPDGTDVRFFALPTDDEDPPGWTMPASYSSPTFGPDGRIYFRKGNGRVVSTEADGTDLRNETTSTSAYGAFSTDANRRGCLSMSADGSRMLVDLTVFERSGSGWTPIAGLEMFQNFWGPAPGNWNGLFPFSGAPIMKSDQCPVLSPDGKHVARAFSVEAETTAPGVAVVTVDPGATDFLQWRFVTEAADSTRMSASWLDNHDLLVTRGKAGTDQATLQRVDLSNIPATDTSGERPVLLPAAATNLGTITWPQSTAHDRAPKLLSDGRYYGDAQCGLWVAGTSTTVVPSGYVPGSSTCFTQFAWDDDAGSTGGGGDTMLGLDPSQAPDPAAPGPADPALVEEGPPAPGAGTDASHPTPDSVGPSSFTIAPGQTADLVLSNNLGALVRYEVDPNVVQPPGGGTVTATGDVDSATELITTWGPVTVSADAATADATGPARIRVRAVGATSWDTIEINIATPLRPSASDDELVVQAGVEATFPESALLDNDSPARPGAELSVIQLSGYDRGSAFLDADGVVHVVASDAGTGTFTYAVAEDRSTAYSTATVTVSAADTPVPVLSISLSSAKVHRGDTITVTGSGFAADEEVTAVMHSGEPFEMGAVSADSTGRIVLTWTIPQTAEIGSHRIVLTGASSGTVEGALQVVAPETQGGGDQGTGGGGQSGTGGGLSGTGFDGGAYAAIALALLLCGAFMILIARSLKHRN